MRGYSYIVLEYLEKKKPSVVGLYQAIAITLYCALIALFFMYITKTAAQPGFFGFFLLLILMVFSAAVTGSLVFGYPTYLAVVRNKIKEASTVLAFTLLYFSAIILITIILIISVFG